MASSFTIIALCSVALFAGIIEARKDPGEYWQSVAQNDEAVIEVIEHLVEVGSALSNLKKITSSHYHSSGKKYFLDDLEPRPNVSAYGEDGKLKDDNSFVRDFKPRPSLTQYSDDVGLKGEQNKLDKDFEPRPSLTRYSDDVGLKGEKKQIG